MFKCFLGNTNHDIPKHLNKPPVTVDCEAFVTRTILQPFHRSIVDAKFKTFGCGSAIASSSLATEWIKNKTIDEASMIQNTQIVEELSLPPVKIHCSVLAEDAIKGAIADYKSKQEINT